MTNRKILPFTATMSPANSTAPRPELSWKDSATEENVGLALVMYQEVEDEDSVITSCTNLQFSPLYQLAAGDLKNDLLNSSSDELKDFAVRLFAGRIFQAGKLVGGKAAVR